MSLFYCCCFVFVFPSGNGEQFQIQHHYFICIPFIFDTINELLLAILVNFFMKNKFIFLDFEFWVLVCIKYSFYLISISIGGWSFGLAISPDRRMHIVSTFQSLPASMKMVQKNQAASMQNPLRFIIAWCVFHLLFLSFGNKPNFIVLEKETVDHGPQPSDLRLWISWFSSLLLAAYMSGWLHGFLFLQVVIVTRTWFC